MAPHLSFAGAVLAGGESHCMGTDKAFVEIDGMTMVSRVAAALRESGADPVVVVGGDRERLEAQALTFVADRHPGEGPLGGIITALGVFADQEAVAVLSCDLTAPHPPAIRAMVGALGTGSAVVPVVEGVAQWHHTAWRPQAEVHLSRRFATGERAPRRAVEGLAVVQLLDSSPCWYHDADRPEDLPRSP